jgi:ectoine hydroxylase-related dioxygenase (phytanoyl-CoA dioxygenase family)
MEGEAAEYVIDLPIKAGTAVVFAMNVFHGSRLNLQNSPRPAMHLALTHKEAQLIHYLHQSPSEKFAVIDCNEDVLYDFIFDMKNGVIPAHAEVLDYIWDAKKLRITESEWLALAANQLNKN